MNFRAGARIGLCWAVVAGSSLAACGSAEVDRPQGPGTIIARVGDAGVTKQAFDHWMTVLAPQHVALDPPNYHACVDRHRVEEPGNPSKVLLKRCADQYAEVKQSALGFLVVSQWTIQEAAAEGMPVSAADVSKALAAKRRSFASAAEFQEALKAIGHTVADEELEIRVELAERKLRKRLLGHIPRVTAGDVERYYRQHISAYHVPEKRYFYIGENFRSPREARAHVKQVAAGEFSIHESLPRKPFSDYVGEKRTIVEAIFKIKPHVVSRPIRLNRWYFLIDVTRIEPPHVQKLARVGAAIRAKLTLQRRRQALAGFIAAWRSRWISRTSCSDGYVVQKCSRHRGPRTGEDPFSFS